MTQPYYSFFSEPTKQVEKDILTGSVDIDSNPITEWMYRNIVLDMDSQENIKPNKQKSANKIDGVVTQIMSIYAFIVKNVNPEPVHYWERDGLLKI